jgi:tetratricopeptide (TPR) repeat protein
VKLFKIPILLLVALALTAQERGQLDASPSLFTVLTAIQAAGLDVDADSSANHPVRAEVRNYIAQRNPGVLKDLKAFHQRHPNATIGNYISLGLAIEGPPLFRLSKGLKEPPPDAVLLEAMTPLLAKLWTEADLEILWKKVEPHYEKVIAESFHQQVSQEILKANAFLRNPTSGYTNRRFQIFVELMAPPTQVHTRSFGDDFYVVVTPTREPQIADIRRAYLYYLLDPLSFKFAKQVKEKSGLLQFAQVAPALDAHYKEDFYLLTTASLVRAVDAKLTPIQGAARLQLVDQSFREGFILTPYFFEHLPVYEQQERAMRLYYGDMISAIDLKQEDKRLANVQWAEAKATKTIRVTSEAAKPAFTGVLKTLDEAEDLYNQKQYPKAKEKFSLALQQTDSRPLHAKSYFGLARIAALTREFEMSEKLFEKTLELDPEAEIKAWTLIYLARMSFSLDELDPALERYTAALAVKGAPPRARDAAEKGLQEATEKKKKQQQ